MAVSLRELRIKARKAGVTNAKELNSIEDLEEAIANVSNGAKSKSSGTKAVKAVKATGKKRGRPKKVVDEVDEAPKKKRGRPKKEAVVEAPKKKRGRPPKADSEKATPKKKKSSSGPGRPVGSGPGTRVSVPEKIDWTQDFNFRDGSTAQEILVELRKNAKKNKKVTTRELVALTFNSLRPQLNKAEEFTFMSRETGKPHKKEAAEKMLNYRINRTVFDFAKETGQHEGAGNGSTAAPKKAGKPKKGEATTSAPKKRGRPPKAVEDDEEEAPKKKRGRPKGSGKKVKAEATSTGKRRGRPPGKKKKARA